MFARSIFAGLALSVALAAPAGAATFTSGPDGLVFTAAPNVANNVGVFGDAQINPPSLQIDTANDPVVYEQMPEGCSDADQSGSGSPASTITCSGTPKITFQLGDLNDVLTATGTTSNVTVLGGSGSDTLTGGGGSQVLSGEDGTDTINGGADNDLIEGGEGFDVIRGGAGDDEVRGGGEYDQVYGDAGADRLFGEAEGDNLEGGDGNDVLEGGDGDDQFGDGLGDDTSRGGGGDDYFFTDGGADTIRGENGSDSVYGYDDAAADDFDGGDGFDLIIHSGGEQLTVDLAAGVIQGDATDAATSFEDGGADADVTTISGTPGPNGILGGYGSDTVDPRAGNDFVTTREGDDTIDLRDGFADRLTCGPGTDSVQADTLDEVLADCETVTRTDVGNAGDVAEDKAPTVAITAPAGSALLSTIAPNTITADAADDKGIARVVFSTGERTICTDETAPYSCDYRPTSADVGRDTLVAIAVDTAGQTASAVRVVNVPRFKATGLSAATTPKRDKKAPYTFTTKGKLSLPAGVLPAAGCKGTVDVSFKAGKKTVSSRRVALESDCSYSSKVTFRLPRRLNPKKLSVVVVYGGNEVVEGIQAKRHTVRPR